MKILGQDVVQPVEEPVSFLQKYRMPIIIGVVALLVIIVVFVVLGHLVLRLIQLVPAVNQGVMVATSAPVEKVKEKKKKIKYAQLFSQMDSGDTSKILKELSIKDITFTTQQAGQKFSISVDQDQLDEARNLLAIKGLPSGTAKKGYELLDDTATLGVTEFDKRIRFLRALSGELEKQFQSLKLLNLRKFKLFCLNKDCSRSLNLQLLLLLLFG